MKYEVQVKFHKNEVYKEGEVIVVGVMARPEGGKANKEVIEKLAEYFNVPQSAISILRGHTSRKKIIEVNH